MEDVFQSVEIFFYFATLQPLMKWGIISSRSSLFAKEPTHGFPVYKSFSDYDIGLDKDSLCTKNCIYFLTHQFKHMFWCSKEPSH